MPSFYEQHGGFVFAMCINKHMHLLLNRRALPDQKIVIRYSQVETVDSVDEIKHPLAREAMKLHGLEDHIELGSIADMPAQSGLGSSGAYLVGLLAAIRAYKMEPSTPQTLAEEACHIEMNILNEPVGKQDQYMAAFGGFRTLDIAKDGTVKVNSVPLDVPVITELVSKARIYYTGVLRSANEVLGKQDSATREKDDVNHQQVMDSLCQIKEIGYQILDAFKQGDVDRFGVLMDEHWQCKKRLASNVSLSITDQIYDEVKQRFGVTGGKIIGAGGGGFFMLYCPRHGRDLDEYMASKGMPRISYFPALKGAHVVSDLSNFDDFGNP